MGSGWHLGGHEPQREIGVPGADGGIAGNDTVEIFRIALRHDHRLAAAGGAAGEIRMLRRATVIRRDRLFRQLSNAPDCHVVKIEAGLLVAEKAAIKAATLVAAIGRDHRESASERWRLTGCRGTQRRSDVAVQSTAALKQEATVPLIGQREGEADAVRFSVRALALIDHAVHAAERRKRGARCARGRSRYRFRFGDRERHAMHLELEHVWAASLSRRKRREDGNQSRKQNAKKR